MMYFEGEGDDTDNLQEYIAQLSPADAAQFKQAQCVYECASRFSSSPSTAIGRIWLSGLWPTQDVTVS
jgi:hypothetical protein